MQRDFRVNNLQDLSLDIYVVGYPGMGEAILTMICDGTSVLFTTLTDCYITSYCNHIGSILDARGISSIDAFIWTHPDEDHSVGICEILEKYDAQHEAEVYLPENFTVEIPFKICGEASKAIHYIKEKYSIGRKYNVVTVGVSMAETRDLIRLRFTENKGERMIRCRWQFLAPFSGLVWRQASKYEFTLNDLSIVYSMFFNGVNFLFCGDLEERTVKFMNGQYFQNVYFVKMPHHGSKGANSLVRKLQESQVTDSLAVTTSFKTTHPCPDTLESYKKISCEIDCTGDAMHTEHLYGCVKTSFNVCSLAFQTELLGNAFHYYQRV